MALERGKLEAAIYAVFKDQQKNTEDPDGALRDIANRLSTAIESFVKSGTVNVNVTTTGNATDQSGSGTGTIS